MKKLVLAGTALAALTATAAIAQPAQRGGQALTRAVVETGVDAGFARADANRDGFLTQDEVRAGRQAHQGQRGLRAERGEDGGERRAALFARLDANRDGSISRSEFENRPAISSGERAERREARSERRGERRGARAEGRRGQAGGGVFARLGGRIFGQADADRDGRVSRAEARSGALALFARVDTNRDGTISVDERRAAREGMRAQRQQRRQS